VLALSCLVWADGSGSDPIRNGWNPRLLDYQRPGKLIVEQTTPAPEQVNFWLRPPQMAADAPEPKETGPAKPLRVVLVGPADVIHLRFQDATGDIVPALLCTPAGRKGPFPLVIAVHGLTSHKVQVCRQVGPVLTAQGYAVLAADMPCHGERPGEPRSIIDTKDPVRSFQNWRKAVIDVRQLIDLSEQLPQIDHKAGVVLLGYSMGSLIDALAGPCDRRVRAMVLMVCGALDTQLANMTPQQAAVDIRLAIAHFAGRPLLLCNGKDDPIATPQIARRLFAACGEPKQQLWYDSGHQLPDQAYADAAKWIAQTAQKQVSDPADMQTDSR
jgi:alpha-beta hydrolase superfamily lysophospholipase